MARGLTSGAPLDRKPLMSQQKNVPSKMEALSDDAPIAEAKPAMSIYEKFGKSANATASPRESQDLFRASLYPIKKNLINVESWELKQDRNPGVEHHPSSSETSSVKALSVLSLPSKSPKAINLLTGIRTSPVESPNTSTMPSPDATLKSLTFKGNTTPKRSAAYEISNKLDENRPLSVYSEVDGMLQRTSRFASNATGLSVASTRVPKSSAASSLRTISRNKLSMVSNTSDVPESPFPVSQTNAAGLSTLGVVYAVAGLPKNPTQWTTVDENEDTLPSHTEGAIDRFFKAELLGSSVVGERLLPNMNELDSELHKSARRRRPKGSTVTKGASELSSDEVAKITAKALKLSFPREVEVISSTLAPSAQASYFSFALPNSEAIIRSKGGSGTQAFNLFVSSTTTRQSLSTPETVYYAASLTIYTSADKVKCAAIRKALQTGKSKELARALKAASMGRKFGKKLEASMVKGSTNANIFTTADTEQETDAFATETENDFPVQQLPSKLDMPMWLPYTLTLVSKYPIYDLMLDVLRVSYARFHTDISQHSYTMSAFLNTTAPRVGEELRVAAGSDDVSFVAKMPGLMNLAEESFVETNYTSWPLFATLSAETLLTICEHALAPLGRVVFVSQYQMLASIAVETIRYILELKGFNGNCHHVVHARDVKLLLEDPGPFLLSISIACRPLSFDAPAEVLFVDLDSDRLECGSVFSDAMTKGSLREKQVRLLEAAIDRPSNAAGVPREFKEAFPSGRFRPLSPVEASGRLTQAERLLPPPNWAFDLTKILHAFEHVLGKTANTGLLSFIRKTKPRKAIKLDSSTLHVQNLMRQHATLFIARRDLLEARIWKLNRRLAFLISESQAWKAQFEIFKTYASQLTSESQELRMKLEREKREAKRLSATVSSQQEAQSKLSQRLIETEAAKEQAVQELAKVAKIRLRLEHQHSLMLQEIASITTPEDVTLPMNLTQASNLSVPTPSTWSLRSMATARRRHRTTSMGSMGSLASRSYYDSEDEDASNIAYDSNAREALLSVQQRLQEVIRRAGRIEDMSETSQTSRTSPGHPAQVSDSSDDLTDMPRSAKRSAFIGGAVAAKPDVRVQPDVHSPSSAAASQDEVFMSAPDDSESEGQNSRVKFPKVLKKSAKRRSSRVYQS